MSPLAPFRLGSALIVWASTQPVWAQSSPASVPSEPSDANSSTANSIVNEAESEVRQQARARFEAGMKLYEDGDYALALLEFERTYSLIPEYRVLYNIAQVNIQLGRYATAARKLRQYLAEGGDSIPAERRSTVLADLEMLAARTATILVRVNVAAAQIVLDDEVIASSPISEPLLIDAGEHRLAVRKLGYVSETRRVALAGRDQSEFDFYLAQETKSPTIEKTVIIERQSPIDLALERRQLWLTAGWVGTGLLATAWAAAGYVGYSTDQTRQSRLTEASSASELSSLKTKTKNWYVAADVLGGVTLGAAATLTYLTFFAPRPSAAMSRNDQSESATGRVRISFDWTPNRMFVHATF